MSKIYKYVVLILLILISILTILQTCIKQPIQETDKSEDTKTIIQTAPTETNTENEDGYGFVFLTPEPTKTEIEPIIITDEDVVFIGNSLTLGLSLYSQSNSKFVCEGGVCLDNLDISELYEMDFKVAIINMGTNELGGYSKDRFMESYRTLLNIILSINPDARIICCSVPPIRVTGDYAAQFNNENAKLYSTYIQTVAQEYDLEYVDNCEFFGNELSESLSGDGIHFGGTTYKRWYDWLFAQVSEQSN